MKDEWNDRMTVIAQNGNEGLHYGKELPECVKTVWEAMVKKAVAGLQSDCPLIEDEVIIEVNKVLTGEKLHLSDYIKEEWDTMSNKATLRYNSDYPRQDLEDKALVDVSIILREVL